MPGYVDREAGGSKTSCHCLSHQATSLPALIPRASCGERSAAPVLAADADTTAEPLSTLQARADCGGGRAAEVLCVATNCPRAAVSGRGARRQGPRQGHRHAASKYPGGSASDADHEPQILVNTRKCRVLVV